MAFKLQLVPVSDVYESRTQKRCKRCNKVKPIDKFTTVKINSDGLSSYCIKCINIISIKWRKEINWNAIRNEKRAANPEITRNEYRSYRLKLKLEFIEEYGGICVCCGESDYRFLTIDHVNDDGHIHRKKFGSRSGSTTQVLADLKRQGWPKDNYRILCFNCNLGRSHNGGICPHEYTLKLVMNAT